MTSLQSQRSKIQIKTSSSGSNFFKKGCSDFFGNLLHKGQKYFDFGDCIITMEKMKNGPPLPAAAPGNTEVPGGHISASHDLPQWKFIPCC